MYIQKRTGIGKRMCMYFLSSAAYVCMHKCLGEVGHVSCLMLHTYI